MCEYLNPLSTSKVRTRSLGSEDSSITSLLKCGFKVEVRIRIRGRGRSRGRGRGRGRVRPCTMSMKTLVKIDVQGSAHVRKSESAREPEYQNQNTFLCILLAAWGHFG